jgi:predicted esterase
MLFLLTLLAFAAPQQKSPTRLDLARAYVRFEQAYATKQAELEAPRRRELHQAFDRATIAFFTGDGAKVLADLEQLSVELGAPAPQPAPKDETNYDELRLAALVRLNRIAVEGEPLRLALESAKARAALLVNQPSSNDSAQFFCDRRQLSKDLIREIEALEKGEDPYRRRLGDWWRVLPQEKGNLPARVYAPLAATQNKPVPLVIALHGAGGDENMFFDAYGAGVIKRLADQRGFLAVAPRVSMRFKPDTLEQMLTALRYHYAIDTARIHVVGHSMGAGAAFSLAAAAPERFAAAACLAGGPRGKAERLPPLLVIAGALDPLANVDGLARTSTALQEAGHKVTFERKEDSGHTLLVTEVLPATIDWLFSQRP